MKAILEFTWSFDAYTHEGRGADLDHTYRIVVNDHDRHTAGFIVERKDLDGAGDERWRPLGQHSSDIDADTLVACALAALVRDAYVEGVDKRGRKVISLGKFGARP